MLTSVSDLGRYVGVFLSAWPPRDGPETAPIRRASLREMQQLWRHGVDIGRARFVRRDSAHLRRLRLRAARLPDLFVPPHRRAQRRPAGIRLGDALAAGVRRRLHRVRQPHLHGLGPRRDGCVRRAGEDRWRCSRDRRGRRPRSPPRATRCRSSSCNGTIGRRQRRRRQSVSRSDQGSASRRDRALARKVGACTPGSGFDSVENALRGRWTMSCERGKLRVAITLAPTMPPRIQYLDVRPAPAEPARTGMCP